MIQLIRNVYFMYSYIIANKMIEVSKVTKAYHKIRTMKRPKMKNFNIVKKLNKVTKQKKLKKHFSKNFKGKVIDGVHELFVLTAGIMLGIKCSVSDDTIRWEGWMDGWMDVVHDEYEYETNFSCRNACFIHLYDAIIADCQHGQHHSGLVPPR